METTQIKIYTRDCNGKRETFLFGGDNAWAEAYAYCMQQAESNADDEILLVTLDGATVYSELSPCIAEWEDLTGFFA